MEARKTCDHESAHALLFLYQGAEVDSVRMFWRQKWGEYRPAGGITTTRGCSSSVTAASYVAGLVAENRRSGIGWNRAQASDSDLTSVRRLTRFSSDEWKAQETARRVLRRYYRVFDMLSSRLLREGSLSGSTCAAIFNAERARLERLGRAVA